MSNGREFYYAMPTQYVFGEGSINKLQDFANTDGLILYIHGQNALKALGWELPLLHQLEGACRNVSECVVKGSNPSDADVDMICASLSGSVPDLIIAAGGGSIIDAAKAASIVLSVQKAQSLSAPPLWADISSDQKNVCSSVPVGVVLTLPASGSECNNSFVIAASTSKNKIAYANKSVQPQFAICDPNAMLSLSQAQLMCACSDIMSHLLEQLFCANVELDHIDAMLYACISSMLEYREGLCGCESKSKALSGIMEMSSIALSYCFSVGRKTDWIAHEIDHRAGYRFGLPHGHVLAGIMPAWIHAASDNEFYAAHLRGFETQCAYSIANGLNGLETVDSYYSSLGLSLDSLRSTIANEKDGIVDDVVSRGSLGRCLALTPALCSKCLANV